MTKALLNLRLTVDHDEVNGKTVPVYVFVKLYREVDDGLVWRIGGELGDECETLPRPKTVAQAKKDARAAYHKQSPFKPYATCL